MSPTPEHSAVRDSDTRRLNNFAELAANELPYPPPASIRAAITDHVRLNRYPDPASADLTAALATHLRTAPQHIMLGAGSSSILQRLTRAVCSHSDDTVLWTTPAFAAFDVFARQAGIGVQRVPHTGGEILNLDAMLKAVTRSTRLIILVNPHNPTGAIAHGEQLDAFLGQIDDNVTVVLDEAYMEFVADPRYADGANVAKSRWAAGHENIVVVRTFSKAYGLAGARIGYGLAPSALARTVNDAAVPRELTADAQVGALAALADQVAMRENVARINDERARVLTTLRRFGYGPANSHGNYLWLPLADDSHRFAIHCHSMGIKVLDIADHGVRVTIGSAADNDVFLRAAHTWAIGSSTAAPPPTSQ
ncbi:histidinol-phosphate transaminase [Amycolatopsis sp. TNS106]|uniref:pyridoxal phosphate-dependent aminotransferase n=1 Tax=Amycolatopsis sp. TNS106 TaxID=2861750 RepID=UPI001C56E8D5|nr:aminotransferase class I/II-fold pyridoxal phosphate-dependent enzyme [Amycolatopsis sp. TNS106]